MNDLLGGESVGLDVFDLVSGQGGSALKVVFAKDDHKFLLRIVEAFRTLSEEFGVRGMAVGVGNAVCVLEFFA